MKLDAIKQEPKEIVQKYFERLDKLFQKGQLQNAEQKRRFLARLRPEIRKKCSGDYIQMAQIPGTPEMESRNCPDGTPRTLNLHNSRL
jgi:hypothetical protein